MMMSCGRSSRYRLGRLWSLAAVATFALLVGTSDAWAEDVTGKWRVEVHFGAVDPGDSIPSDAGNQMTLTAPDGSRRVFRDPRRLVDGDLALREAKLVADVRVDLRAGYGFYSWKNSELYVDFGVGYYEQDFDDIEIAYSLDKNDDVDYLGTGLNRGDPLSVAGDTTKGLLGENWEGESFTAGTITTIPISVNVLARFRPTKRLNPYIGGGLGYYFTEFDSSARWTEIADALDATCVTYVDFREDLPGTSSRRAVVDPNPGPDPGTNPCRRPVPQSWVLNEDRYESGDYVTLGHDLERPRVEAPDTVYLEARGGLEWQWTPKLSIFTDVRFTWAAKEVRVTADGREKFGEGVPSGTFRLDAPPVPEGGKPAYITYYPGYFEDLATGDVNQIRDGIGSPGEYFLNGGTVDYGGWNFSFGVRLTL